jgi:hypothetical protein
MFDSSKNFVAFSAKTTSIKEQGGKVGIPVIVTALPNSPAVTVTFDFDIEGIGEQAAVEGTDYALVNDSKTLSFPNGWGYDTIWIQPIDNEIFTGNKMFNVKLISNSVNYQFGASNINGVTLIDDEHPLKNWLGTYTVDAQSYGNPENWDEVWTVSTEPDPKDVTILLVTILSTPYGGPGEKFPAAFDTEAMTITIAPSQFVGSIYGYADGMNMVHSDYNNFTDPDAPIVGTIEADGTIKIDELGMMHSTAGWVWDAFNTTWAKTGKKAMQPSKINSEKSARFK